MNILVIAHYQSDGSPCAIFVHEQAKEYVVAGHNVYILVPIAIGKKDYFGYRGPNSAKKVIDGIDYRYLRFFSLSRYGENGFNTKSAIQVLKHKLWKEVVRFGADIIQAHTFLFDSDIGLFLKNKLRLPLVITTHGSDLDVPIKKGNIKEVQRIISAADYILTVSRKLENKVREIAPEVQVATILNGCNTKQCHIDSKRKRSILFVGNLIPQKNTDIVIRVFAEVKKRYTDASLVIIGHGTERMALEKLSNSLKLKDSILFTGQIPNEEVLYHMSQSEYFIMPSVNEGFGIVYIEAMACGCITIGTEGEGISDFIRSGENGYLVSPDVKSILDVICKCEKSPHMKLKIIKNCVNEARQLSWASNAEKNIKLFRNIISATEKY